MPSDFSFCPDPVGAANLNRRMHVSLADSLRYVAAQAHGVCAFDEEAIATLIQNLHDGHAFRAETFAAYYSLVTALLEADESAARAAFATLASARRVSSGLQIVPLTAEGLGSRYDTYVSLMNADASLGVGMRSPSPEVAADFGDRFRQGLSLLDRAVPEVAGEVRHLINELVVVVGDPAMPYQFDGGSHFQLWGALFLNADFHQTDYAMAEVIAHESAHSFLFGCCTEEALVENGDDERYASPLRADARPMDGIYHATFVSARMHWTMSRLLAADVLDAGAAAAVRQAREDDATNFDAGYSVLAAHGRLTATGRGLMDDARAYMEAAVTVRA